MESRGRGALRGRLELQEPAGRRATQAETELREKSDLQDSQALLEIQDPKGRRAIQVWVCQDCQDPRDPLEHRAQRGIWMAMTALAPDMWMQTVTLSSCGVLQGRRGLQVLQGLQSGLIRDQSGPQGEMERRVDLDHRGTVEQTDSLEKMEHQDRRVKLGYLESVEHRVNPAGRGLQDPRAPAELPEDPSAST